MTLRSAIANGFSLLADSRRELARLKKRPLESVLEEYIMLLLSSAALSALLSLALSMGRGAYYDLIRHATVNYLSLLNFSLSIAAGVFFFTLFAGTFLLGLLAIIFSTIMRRRYVETVKLLCAALTPVLLLGWVAQEAAIAFLLWSVYLFWLGSRS